LEPAEQSIRAPVLRQLDRGAAQVAVHLSELLLEALEERQRIRARAREAREDAIVVEPPDLSGVVLHDRLADRDLAVAHDHDAALVADDQDGGRAQLRLAGARGP